MSAERVPVLIAGGGLAGLSTAVFLGLRGVPALVCERHRSTYTGVKAQGQFIHAMEALRVAGVADRLHAMTARRNKDFHMVIADSLRGPVRKDFSAPADALKHLSPEDWGQASQAQCEEILAVRAGELGADVRFGTELRSFVQNRDEVVAVIRDLKTGTDRTVYADYLIGADGWRGAVRKTLGVGTHGRGEVGAVIRVLFDADLTGVLDQRDGLTDGRQFAAFHLTTRHGPIVFFTTDVPGRYGVFYNMTPELADLTTRAPGDVAGLLSADLGLAGREPAVVECAETSITCAVADRFADGRVLLVGDAAKVMPPTGGLGGNTAIMDGFYLGWKLAAVLHGQAGDGLLDSHDTERRPVADLLAEQQYANLVQRLRPDLAADDVPDQLPLPMLIFGYRYPVGAIMAEPGDDGEIVEDPAAPSGRPGSRAPYVPLTTSDGEPTSTSALFGSAFVLLTSDPSGSWPSAAAEVAAGLGVEVNVHRIGEHGDLRDPGGLWEKLYGVTAPGAVLVRPDRFIAWRSPRAADADDLASALAAILHRTP
ncbi:polyketide hydroxylase [Amycolatopsis sp. WAC 04197]|uniref:FAD-dependent monooxygenase n=1 Tax=Amycolatopsis sp. WAC 04197 TaxID=2203199 RepID=UPI000F792A96|nr:FAD-dependent monooxygenase [Amycolatopsis sp. WAC 04197]RSN39567.1 polyketide hydroxylase [Amycolatopsis sp. WAC 04197]